MSQIESNVELAENGDEIEQKPTIPTTTTGEMDFAADTAGNEEEFIRSQEDDQKPIKDELERSESGVGVVGGGNGDGGGDYEENLEEGGDVPQMDHQIGDVGEESNEEVKGDDENADAATATTTMTAEIEPTGRDYTSSEYYQQMLSYGVAEAVIGELIEMIDSGIIKHEEVEERLFESLKTIRPDHCAFILRKFREANLLGINNIPAYLGSLLKNFKERVRLVGENGALAQPIISAPPADKIQPILERTGYSLEVTIGQRKFGGPPPDWGDAPIPGNGHELYVGKLPRDVLEDELIPLFEECGKMYDLRLMMDPITGYNKGYAFVTYVTKEAASTATQKYEGYEIRKGKRLRVNVSIANTRLFIGNIPKSKGKDEILEEFTKAAELEGITEVIIYASPDDPERKRNRGFCFLEFLDHRAASQAKRRLATGRIRPWNGDIVVDWAEPQEEPDEETMSQVKVVYIKPLRESVTEDELKEQFKEFGEIERVKKIKDYAFVHYMDRADAMKAINAFHGKELLGEMISCSLARPQMDRKKPSGRGAPSGGGSGGGGGGGGYGGGYTRGGRDRGGSYGGGRSSQGSGGGGYSSSYYGGGRGGGGGSGGGGGGGMGGGGGGYYGNGYSPRSGGGAGYGYGAPPPSYYGGGGGEYDYGAPASYGGGGYNYGGYGGYRDEMGGGAGGEYYGRPAYPGYYGDPSGGGGGGGGGYGQPPAYQPPPPVAPRGGGARGGSGVGGGFPRGGSRGRGGVPIRGGRGSGGQTGGPSRGGPSRGGGGGYSPRGVTPMSSGGGPRSSRGGPSGGGGSGHPPMKRKGDFDNGSAKRRPGRGGAGRGGWRGSSSGNQYSQNYNFAEDSYN